MAVSLPRPVSPSPPPPSLGSAQRWLYSLTGLGWQMELETPRALMRALGEPLASVPALHVAGSNGKGSLVEMCTELLRASGLRVGTYTSPHLIRLTERVRLDGREIRPSVLASCLDRVRAACRRLSTPRHPSFFECLTAAAYLAFHDAGVDLVVAETGLGGRLDASRFLPWTLVQAFGPTGLEHRDRLGRTLYQIAGEKAALLAPGIPAVISAQPPGARERFRLEADRSGSLALEAGRDYDAKDIRNGPGGVSFRLVASRDLGLPPGRRWTNPMPGRHQAWNGAAALLASSLALKALGLRPDPRALSRGLSRARVPGRFQILPGRPRVILDTACNPDALESVLRNFRELFPGRRPLMLAGFLKDKELGPSARVLARISPRLIAVTPPLPDRARPASETAAAFRRAGGEALAVDDPPKALALAHVLAGREGLILVTGSLFLVGQVLASLPAPD